MSYDRVHERRGQVKQDASTIYRLFAKLSSLPLWARLTLTLRFCPRGMRRDGRDNGMFVGSYRNVYAPGGFSFGGWADNGASSVDGSGNCYGDCVGVFTQNPAVSLGSWSQLYDLYVNGEDAIVEEPGPTCPSVDNNRRRAHTG